MAKTKYPTKIENGIEIELARSECQPNPKLLEARKNATRYTLVEKKHLLDLLQGKEISDSLKQTLLRKTDLKYQPEYTYPSCEWEVKYYTITGSYGTAPNIYAENIHEAAFNCQMWLSLGSDLYPEDFLITGVKLVKYIEKDPTLS